MAKPKEFLLEVKGELKKVVWPTRAEAVRLTATVLAVSLLVGLYVGSLDLIFTKVMEVLVQR